MNIQEKKEELSKQITKAFSNDSAMQAVVRKLVFNNSNHDIEQVMHEYMPETVEERELSVGEALFNCHINNAEERAIKNFKASFSEDVFEREIQPYIDNGIMSIFNDKPNKYTVWFIEQVQKIVNKG